MKKYLQVIVGGAAVVGSVMLSAGPAAAAQSERASEIGHCSAFFGKAGQRNVIAEIIRDDDGAPGLFYREVAKFKGSEACPAEE